MVCEEGGGSAKQANLAIGMLLLRSLLLRSLRRRRAVVAKQLASIERCAAGCRRAKKPTAAGRGVLGGHSEGNGAPAASHMALGWAAGRTKGPLPCLRRAD